MPINRRLITDYDFEEAVNKNKPIRVFQNDQIADNKTYIIRFDDDIIATQSEYGDVTYHRRNDCEFFVLR